MNWDFSGPPPTAAEIAANASAETLATDTAFFLNASAKEQLSDAVALADLYPAPTPDETALIDAQVASALLSYTQLENPPADIVALASNLAVLKIEGRL